MTHYNHEQYLMFSIFYTAYITKINNIIMLLFNLKLLYRRIIYIYISLVI